MPRVAAAQAPVKRTAVKPVVIDLEKTKKPATKAAAKKTAVKKNPVAEAKAKEGADSYLAELAAFKLEQAEAKKRAKENNKKAKENAKLEQSAEDQADYERLVAELKADQEAKKQAAPAPVKKAPMTEQAADSYYQAFVYFFVGVCVLTVGVFCFMFSGVIWTEFNMDYVLESCNEFLLAGRLQVEEWLADVQAALTHTTVQVEEALP